MDCYGFKTQVFAYLQSRLGWLYVRLKKIALQQFHTALDQLEFDARVFCLPQARPSSMVTDTLQCSLRFEILVRKK